MDYRRNRCVDGNRRRRQQRVCRDGRSPVGDYRRGFGLAAYHYRHVENFRLSLSALWLAVVFSSGFVTLTYLAARWAPPLIDGWLVRCDSWLGFSTLRSCNTLHRPFLTIAYNSLLVQTAATISVWLSANRREPLERFFQQMMVAGLIVLACFLVMPAVGPWAVNPSADQCSTWNTSGN